MTVHQQFFLVCDQCGCQYTGFDGDCYGETAQDVKAMASEDGWTCDHRVPNGSDWDFCRRCFETYKEERTEE